MSSVLIKDIFGKERPMPQEGYIDVRLHFRGGRVECATMQTGNPPFYATFKTVEIPTPHGRLIDADELKADYGMKDECADCEKELKGTMKSCEYDRIYSKMDFCQWIDNAETVIEAEGSEE